MSPCHFIYTFVDTIWLQINYHKSADSVWNSIPSFSCLFCINVSFHIVVIRPLLLPGNFASNSIYPTHIQFFCDLFIGLLVSLSYNRFRSYLIELSIVSNFAQKIEYKSRPIHLICLSENLSTHMILHPRFLYVAEGLVGMAIVGGAAALVIGGIVSLGVALARKWGRYLRRTWI